MQRQLLSRTITIRFVGATDGVCVGASVGVIVGMADGNGVGFDGSADGLIVLGLETSVDQGTSADQGGGGGARSAGAGGGG